MGRTISSHVPTLNRAPPSGGISNEKSFFLQYVIRNSLFFSAFAVFLAAFAFRTKKCPLKSHRVRSNFSSALDATAFLFGFSLPWRRPASGMVGRANNSRCMANRKKMT